MASLTVQQIALTGLEPSLVAADSGGDEFTAGPSTFLRVDNADASPHTATVDSTEDCDQGFDHDVAVAVPAGETRLIGPLSRRRFGDGSGNVQVTYDAVTSVTVAAISL